MKLLIITQKVDKNDPVLGFFHSWIDRLSMTTDFITVICLEKGTVELPDNVRVLSLGKENGSSRLKYIFNFYKYIWQFRNKYQVVFVHMNQEYVLLGWLFWRLLRKKIIFWRNHPEGSFLTRIAVWFSNQVLCTSTFSYTAQFKKTAIMPVGINTSVFKRLPEVKKEPDSILVFGRISPVKKLEVFIEACKILQAQGINFTAVITGDALPIHQSYYNELKKQATSIQSSLSFRPGISNLKAPELYNQFEIYVNMTPSGSFDKTMLEAMACETITLASNKSLAPLVSDNCIFEEGKALDLANRLKIIFQMDSNNRKNLAKEARQAVVQNHDIDILIKKLVAYSDDGVIA